VDRQEQRRGSLAHRTRDGTNGGRIEQQTPDTGLSDCHARRASNSSCFAAIIRGRSAGFTFTNGVSFNCWNPVAGSGENAAMKLVTRMQMKMSILRAEDELSR